MPQYSIYKRKNKVEKKGKECKENIPPKKGILYRTSLST